MRGVSSGRITVSTAGEDQRERPGEPQSVLKESMLSFINTLRLDDLRVFRMQLEKFDGPLSSMIRRGNRTG